MGNGICRIFDRSYRHFGMRDHARMIAARNAVDFRLRTRGEFRLNIGWYDFVGLAHDVPRRDPLPTDCSRRFIRQAACGERSLRRGQARRNLRGFRRRKDRPKILRIHVEICVTAGWRRERHGNVKSAGGGGALASSSWIDSPASGAKAST
jgi:hypothetical protein